MRTLPSLLHWLNVGWVFDITAKKKRNLDKCIKYLCMYVKADINVYCCYYFVSSMTSIFTYSWNYQLAITVMTPCFP